MEGSTRRFRPQSGAIPYRRNGEHLEIMLVTSATRKRWIIPKGNLAPSLDARESARIEAYEEAGVLGRVHPVPLGFYLHDRGDSDPTRVEVYLMEVERILPEDRWPEHQMRRRRWMPLTEAQGLVMEDGLKDLFSQMAELLV